MQRVDALSQRVVHPAERLAARLDATAELALRLQRAARRSLGEHRRSADTLRHRLHAARPALIARTRSLQQACERLLVAARGRLQRPQERLPALTRALEHLHPDRVLERGYCIASDAQGRIVADAAQLRSGDALGVRFARGHARTRVESTGGD